MIPIVQAEPNGHTTPSKGRNDQSLKKNGYADFAFS